MPKSVFCDTSASACLVQVQVQVKALGALDCLEGGPAPVLWPLTTALKACPATPRAARGMVRSPAESSQASC